jgi:predicted DNA-binding transcriptional regulator AlpA
MKQPGTEADPMRVRSIADAAKRAGISIATMRRVIRDGSGPRVMRLSERRLGIRDADFAMWLESRTPVGMEQPQGPDDARGVPHE